MKNAVILHGTRGTPQGNWFPWLKEKLQSNYRVTIPTLPTPEDQSLENWIDAFQKQIISNPDLIIGHSLGATFILHLMQRDLIEPRQTILVSPVTDKINNAEYDALNESFIQNAIDYKKLQVNNIKIIYGDDDPYVPSKQPQNLAENLGMTAHVVKNGGHLNAESGYLEFPLLMDYIDA